MIPMMFLALAATQASPNVVSILEGDDLSHMEIVADLVERPAGSADGAFAQQLVDAEGLRPWNGVQENSPPNARMAYKGVSSGDGREIIVYYAAGAIDAPGRVCRLRAARGGFSDARYRAYRWCASAFGIATPEVTPPPVVETGQR